MDLAPYVAHLRNDLAEAAAAGGEEAHEAAERLALALDPATRMVLLEALSDASAEITSELEDTSIEVRMRGREPQFVIDRLPVEAGGTAESDETVEPEAEEDEDGAVARVTVRIPESLKSRAEDLAAARSQSLNAWIVQAIRFATRDRAISFDLDLGSQPWPPTPPGAPGPNARGRTPRRVRGWSR